MKGSGLDKRITILIPVFNEEETIDLILTKIMDVVEPWDREIIVINDGSTDNTLKKLQRFLDEIVLINFKKNQGKGAALREGIKQASGDIVIVQDADLEYDPKDYPKLIAPIVEGRTKVVFGSRNIGKRKYVYKRYLLGGLFLTKLINIIFGSNLSDINTGYKVFDTKTLKEIGIKSNRFEVCEELTIKALKRKLNIVEVPISYTPRSFEQGKKIKWLDGLKAIRAIFFFWLFD